MEQRIASISMNDASRASSEHYRLDSEMSRMMADLPLEKRQEVVNMVRKHLQDK